MVRCVCVWGGRGGGGGAGRRRRRGVRKNPTARQGARGRNRTTTHSWARRSCTRIRKNDRFSFRHHSTVSVHSATCASKLPGTRPSASITLRTMRAVRAFGIAANSGRSRPDSRALRDGTSRVVTYTSVRRATASSLSRTVASEKSPAGKGGGRGGEGGRGKGGCGGKALAGWRFRGAGCASRRAVQRAGKAGVFVPARGQKRTAGQEGAQRGDSFGGGHNLLNRRPGGINAALRQPASRRALNFGRVGFMTPGPTRRTPEERRSPTRVLGCRSRLFPAARGARDGCHLRVAAL